jgi:hypothetical protein
MTNTQQTNETNGPAISDARATRITLDCLRFGVLANLDLATVLVWSSVDFRDYEYNDEGLTAVYFDAENSTEDNGLALRVPVSAINQ